MASEIPWVQPVAVHYYLLISTLFGDLQLKWIHTYDFNYDYYDVIYRQYDLYDHWSA